MAQKHSEQVCFITILLFPNKLIKHDKICPVEPLHNVKCVEGLKKKTKPGIRFEKLNTGANYRSNSVH